MKRPRVRIIEDGLPPGMTEGPDGTVAGKPTTPGIYHTTTVRGSEMEIEVLPEDCPDDCHFGDHDKAASPEPRRPGAHGVGLVGDEAARPQRSGSIPVPAPAAAPPGHQRKGTCARCSEGRFLNVVTLRLIAGEWIGICSEGHPIAEPAGKKPNRK